MTLLARVVELLPKVGEQLWQRRMNRKVFGRSTLDGLNLRAYPIASGYTARAGEAVHDQRWTRFVVGWLN